jgi:hypothetical protein
MSRVLEIITPHWPSGFDRWESFLTLVIIGLFKLDRGTIMYRRARVIDRLGWSIIVFDWTMGALFLISMFWTLYPDTRYGPWLPRAIVLILLVTTIWQWLEIRKASPVRVDLVAAGANGGTVYRPADDQPILTDRRNGLPGRRITDFSGSRMED